MNFYRHLKLNQCFIYSGILFFCQAFNSHAAQWTIPKVKITAYSANCKHDPWGGKNESPSGLKPRSHTVDGKAENGVVLAAVPQKKGETASYRGCFFTIPSLFPGKKFFAGDFYSSKSDGLKKVDISHECNPGINAKTKFADVLFNSDNCDLHQFKRGKRGGAGQTVKRLPPPPVDEVDTAELNEEDHVGIED